MPAPGNTAGLSAPFDWSVTDLGPQAQWPAALQLAVNVVHNTPLPMLLVWGPRRICVYNDAYAASAGLRPASVPGGFVPAVLPPLLGALPDAFGAAWDGTLQCLRRQSITMPRAGKAETSRHDIYLTPVPGAAGQVDGVLIALAEPSAAPDAPPGNLRILVVEDNLDSQYLVCEMLKAFGHDAHGVGDAEGALAMLSGSTYDVLFSDVSLPGMSGVEMARQAVARQAGLHVIFASGYGDSLLRHLDFPHQSLLKPYELEQLQQALANICEQMGGNQ